MYAEVSYITCVNVSVKPQPELKKKKLSSLQQQLKHFSLGLSGERRAVHHLLTQNLKILDTNVVFGRQEVDIVAFDTTTKELVFVEVKTRSQTQFGHSSQAVNHKKLRAMKNVASAYCKKHQLSFSRRFDIICIWPGTIEHFENVTWY
jgi:putative endonuclease